MIASGEVGGADRNPLSFQLSPHSETRDVQNLFPSNLSIDYAHM